MASAVPDDLIRFSRVAHSLGVHPRTLHRWRLHHGLAAWKVGGLWCTSDESLSQFIASRTAAAGLAAPAAAATVVQAVFSRRKRRRIEAAKAYFGLPSKGSSAPNA